MPNAAQVKFNEIDLTQRVAEIDKGIVAVLLQTKRGPFGVDDEVINSWEQWKAKYGGESVDFAGATLVKRMFNYGARVRTAKVGHYTDVSDPGTLDAVKAALPETFGDNGEVAPIQLFDLAIKYAGADYNSVNAIISDASNGDASFFDLTITHDFEPGLSESYPNLKCPGALTASEQSSNPDNQWLKRVAANSKLVDPVYVDTSAALEFVPVNVAANFAGGSDGGAVVDADYSGDAAGTGVYLLDDFDDFTHFAVLDNFTDAVIQACSSYAAAREDCVLLASLDYSSYATSTALTTQRSGLNIDNRYVYFITGGININDVPTGVKKDYNELGDVLGIAAKSEADHGPWWSFAGHNRGTLRNINGVVNNFGTPGKKEALNDLAKQQINTVINRKGKVMVWGNFSGQLEESVKSFIANVKLGIYIKKSLEPTLEAFLEEPNDVITWKRIYDVVKPFFEQLAADRAVQGGEGEGWQWKGDQDAKDLDSLQINTKGDVLAGKYKVQLVLVETVSMQEFTINIISSLDAGVEFEF